MCIASSSSNQRCLWGHYASLSCDQGTQMEPNRNDEGCICPRQRGVVKEQATGGYKPVAQGKSSTLMEVTQWLTEDKKTAVCFVAYKGPEKPFCFILSITLAPHRLFSSRRMPKCDHCQGCSVFILIFLFSRALHMWICQCFAVKLQLGTWYIYVCLWQTFFTKSTAQVGWEIFQLTLYILYVLKYTICLNCRLYRSIKKMNYIQWPPEYFCHFYWHLC